MKNVIAYFYYHFLILASLRKSSSLSSRALSAELYIVLIAFDVTMPGIMLLTIKIFGRGNKSALWIVILSYALLLWVSVHKYVKQYIASDIQLYKRYKDENKLRKILGCVFVTLLLVVSLPLGFALVELSKKF